MSILFCCSNAKADLPRHVHLLQYHVPHKMSSEWRTPGLPACMISSLGLPPGIEGVIPLVLLFHHKRYHTNQHSSRHEQVTNVLPLCSTKTQLGIHFTQAENNFRADCISVGWTSCPWWRRSPSTKRPVTCLAPTDISWVGRTYWENVRVPAKSDAAIWVICGRQCPRTVIYNLVLFRRILFTYIIVSAVCRFLKKSS